MLGIPGHEIIGPRRMNTLEENIIVRIETDRHSFRWPNPVGSIANCPERSGNDIAAEFESRPGDDFFVLGVDTTADTHLNCAAKSEQEYLGWWAKRL